MTNIDLNGPYYYNSPINYNENCFFYNGGYDLICLGIDNITDQNRHIGRSGGILFKNKEKLKSFPQPETIQFIFKTHITHVNNDFFENDINVKKYNIPKNNSTIVKVQNFKLKTIIPEVKCNLILKNKTNNLIIGNLDFIKFNDIKISTTIFKK